MKTLRKTILLFIVAAFIYSCSIPNLPKPSPAQYKWQEQERIMFVCLDPCTWQGREYDNHSTPLERINPEKLNTDQWCEVARSWGAKEILFVAKHTGGFCWWQTNTTDYGIKNTPYKNGRGDVLKELSESCKKYNLNLGIYVYPGDETWGAGIGSGGLTKDTTKQEAYNKIFRQQLTECLTNYGDVLEVWFDGSCKINVSDILEKYAANSVIFQGAHATLRWPGTETGRLFYPVWNTINSKDLKTGVSTQLQSDPNGDAWAPLESDTPLYDHFWFWSPEKEKKRKSIDELMDCYYKSVGYGGVLLLNSTPDTTGLIPEGDVLFYKALCDEIDRRFKNPLAEVKDKKGKTVVVELSKKEKVNHVVTMEDYRYGQRIRSYKIEGWTNGQWQELCSGQSVGRKKIDYFPEVEVSKVRIRVDKSVGTPLIRSLSVYYVDNFVAPAKEPVHPYSPWVTTRTWVKSEFKSGQIDFKIDLTGQIKLPGQFTVKLEPTDQKEPDLEIVDARIYYDGEKSLPEFLSIKGNEVHINRTAMVTDESSSVLHFSLKCGTPCSGKVLFRTAAIN